MIVTFSVDPSLGVAYVKFSDEQIVKTVEVTPSVQVDLDAAGTVVGVELLSPTDALPIDALNRFGFPPHTSAQMISRISSVSYVSQGQGHAYVPPTPVVV
jgi:uncharacterized protein YuzE